jgi:4-aminobutyrate aminotransferase-like enzyme
VDSKLSAKEVQSKLLARGIVVGTSDVPRTFRLLPPLTVGEDDWETFFRALEDLAR